MTERTFQLPQNVKMNFEKSLLFSSKKTLAELRNTSQQQTHITSLTLANNSAELMNNLVRSKEPFVEVNKVINPDSERKTILPFSKKITQQIANKESIANLTSINDNPNSAYLINFNTVYNDSVTAANQQRWYAFQLTEKKKITLYMNPVADTTIDNDLYLYQFNQANSSITAVAMSRNNAGMYENLSYIAAPGIYFVSVNSYACSAANNFQLLALISDTWDENEADDSMAMAVEMPVNSEITGTLDNIFDEDTRIWLVKETGTYQMLLSVPSDKLKYKVKIYSASEALITTVEPNVRTFFPNVAAGDYFLKITSEDNNIDSAVSYNFSLILLPPDIVDNTKYTASISQSGKQLVEFLMPGAIHGLERNALTVDRKEIQAKLLQVTVGRPDFPGYQCGGYGEIPSIINNSVMIGKYETDYNTFNNALIFKVSNCLFFNQMKQKVYKTPPSSYGQPSYIGPEGTDQFGGHYRQYTYRDEFHFEIQFVFDIDQNRAVDMYNPNFFYGFQDRAGVCGHGKHNFTVKTSLAI